MSTLFSPLRTAYRYLQRQAHEQPVLYYSVVIGLVGPLLIVTVPPVRQRMGWEPAERPPTSYPLPKRARVPVLGYDDE
ncbi:hypothetical protein BDW22DRAFT_1432756 [Trametopsis cervina]|nr:hypothetical protein BDW22DRAFT_1432756 [Trametopsis cervina]